MFLFKSSQSPEVLNCNTIVENKKDPLGRYVTKVYYSDRQYAIYEISNSDQLIFITENVVHDSSKISCEIDDVKKILSKEKIQKYQHRFAKAYRECFEGNLETAKKIVSSVEESFKNERKNLLGFKYTYIITACIALIANFLISIIFLDFNLELTNTINDLYFVATFGSLGCLISISTTIKNTTLDFFVRKLLYFFDALFRIIVSMASAITVYYLIRGNIVLGFLNGLEDNSSDIIFIFSILAGFSERYVPKLFGLLEEKQLPTTVHRQ